VCIDFPVSGTVPAIEVLAVKEEIESFIALLGAKRVRLLVARLLCR